MARKKANIHYIYKTTCNVTGRWYVGMHSTNNEEDGYMGSGKILRYSIRKYGVDNHTKEILEYCNSRAEEVVIPIYEDDTETMIKIKKLMAFYGIANIYLRMFKIPELLKIQGFPDDYVLVGTQAEQKKYIGNAVEVTIARKLFEAHSIGIAYLRSLDAYTLTELLTSLKIAV